MACPHCARWNNDVFPDFKKKYIDTGQVRFVFRELLYGDPTLATAGFLTARWRRVLCCVFILFFHSFLNCLQL